VAGLRAGHDRRVQDTDSVEQLLAAPLLGEVVAADADDKPSVQAMPDGGTKRSARVYKRAPTTVASSWSRAPGKARDPRPQPSSWLPEPPVTVAACCWSTQLW